MRVRWVIGLVVIGLALSPVSAQSTVGQHDGCLNPVRIVTWNMENFTVNRTEDEAAFQALADTWAALDADVVAVQEIGAEQSVAALLEKVEAETGRHYDFALADWPGARQQVGFAWDTATIQPQGEPEQIDSVRLGNLRPAFAQEFLFDDGAGGVYDFALVTLHLKATMEEGSRRIRSAQSKLLADWLAERPADADRDVIFLGDFNDSVNSESLAPLTGILYFTDADFSPDAYTYIGEGFYSLIDHLALTPGEGAQDEFCSVSLFDPGQIDLDEDTFESLASDHLPVIGVFSAGIDED